jgi:uncharacterized protein YcfJ
MSRSSISSLIVGALVATTGAAIAGYALKEKQPDYAQVVEVKPVQKAIRTPRQECHDETVSTQAQRCETVYDTHIERHGYDVRYRVGEQEGNVRMGHDPGDRIPMRAGQLVLNGRTGAG